MTFKAVRLLSVLTTLVALWAHPVSQAAAATACTSQHVHVGDRPRRANTGWHQDTQGITHDEEHWFISQQSRLWKIDVATDLGRRVRCGKRYDGHKVRCSPKIGHILPIHGNGYDHFGDLTYYDGMLIVPLEDNSEDDVPRPGGYRRPPALAVFDAEDLSFIAQARLLRVDGRPAASGPWAAVGRDGIVYSSDFHLAHELLRWAPDWDLLRTTRAAGHPQLRLHPLPSVPLLFAEGDGYLEGVQGGAFDVDGRLLYLNAGYSDDLSGSGIRVMELHEESSLHPCDGLSESCVALEIERSKNANDSAGPPDFYFKYYSGGITREEPEGITVWDLSRVPRANSRMHGSLHAILLDNDWPDDDDVYIKHYDQDVFCSPEPTGVVISRPSSAGYRVDACSSWASGCGQPAADLFCRRRFGSAARASDFRLDSDVGDRTPTRTQLDGRVCRESFCDAFESITCETASVEESIVRPRVRDSAQAMRRLDWCLLWGHDCGRPAADRFCEDRWGPGARADGGIIDPDIGLVDPTWVVGEQKLCTDSFCDGFEHIRCRVPVRSERFTQPTLDGYRVDWCASWSSGCGEEAADRFCDRMLGNGAIASDWEIDADIGANAPTRTQVDQRVCRQSFCDGFASITCESAPGATETGTGGSHEQKGGNLGLLGAG